MVAKQSSSQLGLQTNVEWDPCIGSKDDETDPKLEVIWKVIKVVAQLALLLYRF